MIFGIEVLKIYKFKEKAIYYIIYLVNYFDRS